MKSVEILETLEKLKETFEELGFPFILDYDKQIVFRTKGIGQVCPFGIFQVVIKESTVNIFVRLKQISEDEFLFELPFNIPLSSDLFSEGHSFTVFQQETESIEVFLERFKARLLGMELELVFKRGEYYYTEVMVKKGEEHLAAYGKTLSRSKLIKILLEETKKKNEEELEFELMDMDYEFEMLARDYENVLSKFWYTAKGKEYNFIRKISEFAH